jgi:transcriptional regulator with XRE-family HTH domain
MGALRKIFGKNLRKARLASGHSQESLAAESKIDRTYISGIERGVRNPSLDYIERLADALGVDPGVLVGKGERAAT